MIQSWTMSRSGVLALAAWAGLGFAGCGGAANHSGTVGPDSSGASSGTGRIVLVTNGNSDWWSAVEKGMKDGAAKHDADVQMKRNQEGAGTEGQIRLLEEALGASEVKAVAVSAVDADAPGIADAMRKLKEAGKLVITIDSDVNTGAADARSHYIGTNNAKAGEIAGQAAATIRPQGGSVAVFVGSASAENARARLDGFFTGAGPKFLRSTDMIYEDQHDTNRAQSLPEIAITKDPEIGVMLGLYSYNAPRIAAEVAKRPDFRKKTSVVTFDLDEQAVAFLEKGDIDVSVCQNPYEIGYQAVRLLSALMKDDKTTVEQMFPEGQTSLDTGVRVIVPTADSPVKGAEVITIEDMKKWLADKGLKSS
ncbi:substrate-binding domain-containing protein [Tundrisphaera lichenicola]|uniref:substrate-binding domain-containing protein n=1 Tax=Tundrisphaera lichenicola TaxID=2029860 RepID=UPI003EBA17C0